MSKKKAYNAGLAAGARASEAAINRNTEAVEYLRREVEKLPEEYREIRDILSQMNADMESAEISRLFGIEKTFSVQDLEWEEKILLIRAILRLSELSAPNDAQKAYLRGLICYLHIREQDALQKPEDARSIGELIDSKSVQQAMYRVCKEYLYLAESTHDYGDKYEKVLEEFDCVNAKFIREAEAYINVKVGFLGEEWLIGQFGPETEKEMDKTETEAFRMRLSIFLQTSFMSESTKDSLTAWYSFVNPIAPTYASDYSYWSRDSEELGQLLQDGQIDREEIVEELHRSDDDRICLCIYHNAQKNIVFFCCIDCFYIRKKGKLISIKHANLKRVTETPTDFVIELHQPVEGCDANADSPCLTYRKPTPDYVLFRSIRHLLEGVIAQYTGLSFIGECNVADITEIVKKHIRAIAGTQPCHLWTDGDDVFDKKCRKAVSKYAHEIKRDDVVGFVDTSVLGGGGAGVLFARDSFAVGDVGVRLTIPYDKLQQVILEGKKLYIMGAFEKSPLRLENSFLQLNQLKACLDEIMCIT